MSRRRVAAVAVATATLTLISPSMTETSAAAALVLSGVHAARCAQRMRGAVVQDNVSYNARDEEAYVAVIHPDIIFHVAGTTSYGIDAHMEAVRAAWRTRSRGSDSGRSSPRQCSAATPASPASTSTSSTRIASASSRSR